jgi:hypothetical protein
MENSITLENILKVTKKKEPVKTVTSQTCSNKLKIRVLQMGIPFIIPEEFEQCIGCNDYEGNYECERFHPYQFTFPIRTGIYATPSTQ